MSARRPLFLALAALVAAACTTGSGSPPGQMTGVHDVVLVDDLPTDGGLAVENRLGVDAGLLPPDLATTGIPNRYAFFTSTDSNELKVLNLWVPGYIPRSFVPAPNPLSALAIPVLDRPSVLAVDEGLSAQGQRVTGPFVYAVRPGAAQLSVVDATTAGMVQVTRSPLATPAPVSALAAWMGAGLTDLPATTTVYLATWDGDRAALWSLPLPTARARRGEVRSPRYTRLADLGAEVVVAMKMVPPHPARNLGGRAFCAGPASCLALVTRANQGTAGRTLLVQLDTLETATIDFGSPVRELSGSGPVERLYALLDEEGCDAGCSGAVAADLLAGSAAGVFSRMNDFTGQPMQPIRALGAVPGGVAVARYTGQQSLTIYRKDPDGGLQPNTYSELGFVSSSTGQVYLFSGQTGTPIDWLQKRSWLAAAALRVPLPGEDGGATLYLADGGTNFEQLGTAVVETEDTVADPSYRSYSLVPDGGSRAGDPPTSLLIGDGYLFSQTISVTRQGVIAGLSLLPTTAGDQGTVHFTPGLESRLRLGDLVAFGAYVTLDDGTSVAKVCGEAPIVALGSGTATVAAVPDACGGRTLFSIAAGPAPTPLVVNGDVEGFMGRFGEDDAGVPQLFEYRRRYVVKPETWDGTAWPAISLQLGAMPPGRGAAWLFGVEGEMQLYHVGFDPTTVPCLPYVAGPVRAAPLPNYVTNDATLFPWSLMTVYPGGNGAVLVPILAVYDTVYGGPMTYSNGAVCFR